MTMIRTAGPGDLPLLPDLEAASDTLLAGRPEIRGELLGTLPPAASPAELAAARHLLVAGEPPAGFARLEEVGGCAHLEQLSVHPSAAGAGLGRALVAAAARWAEEEGFPALTLCTFARVPFNAPFYASCGFTAVEPDGELARIRRHEEKLGLDRIGERVAMRLELRPGRHALEIR
ncbi:GNAT family N-acetyltransferase [Arthrobacter sp. NPDC055585]